MNTPDFEKLLEKDSSRAMVDYMVNLVGDNSNYLELLFQLSLQENSPSAWRAARVLDACLEKNTLLTIDYPERIISVIDTLKNVGIRRSFFRILMRQPVPTDELTLSVLLDAAYNAIISPQESIAVKAYCTDILMKITIHIPELIPEFLTVMQQDMPNASVGMRNKYKNTILKLQTKLEE